MDAIVLLGAGPIEINASMDVIVSLGLRRKRPSETSACMDAIVLLRVGLSEIFASMDTFVSLRLQRERPGETKAFVHAFISLGGRLSETFASMDAFVSPSLQGYGLPDRARQGFFPARESYGKYPPASSTASDVKW